MTRTGALVEPLRRIHIRMRDAIVAACEAQEATLLSGVAHDGVGDTLYVIDRVGEDVLLEAFDREIASFGTIVLIAEGLPDGGQVVLPKGATASSARWRVIVDPIDGTRGLMYQKRSAWILTGVAPNLGEATALSDIVVAVQTEVPLVKQHLTDQVWAVRGTGVHAERVNRLSGTQMPLTLRPSQTGTIAHGFATVSRFFPGARDVLAAVDDEVVANVLGPVVPGKAQCFEDQYISTGGQLFELMAGHDRFVADLRPLAERVLRARGQALGLCCHPYDICTALIARELGVILTAPNGARLDCPLDLGTDVAWVGYANDAIWRQVEGTLQATLRRHGLL